MDSFYTTCNQIDTDLGLNLYHDYLVMARGNEIDSHSSCLFAKSRSGTYPRFRLFALMPPGTYPRFLGSQGTYPPVFAPWTFAGTCQGVQAIN